MIREFHHDDIDQVVGLLAILHLRTPYRCVKPDWPEVVQLIAGASSRRGGKVLVAEHDGKITGVLIAVAQTLWWQNAGTGARVVSDLIFFSQRVGDGRRMLKQMIAWAFTVPRVVRVECGISSGQDVQRLEQLYVDCGLVREGTSFVVNHPKYEAALRGERVAA